MHSCFGQRKAITVTETVVATLLLALAAGVVLRMAVSIHGGLRDQELNTRLDWELVNARERIGSWPIEKITEESITSLPIEIAMVREPRWTVSISDVEEPLPALQVDLRLVCEMKGQSAEPRGLTFWIPKPSKKDQLATAEVDSLEGDAND